MANPNRLPTDRVLLLVAGGVTTMGVLSPELFANGHTFFVQGFRENALSVHATHQYGDHEAFAYGKRMRFRQAGLWKADEASYGDGKFLQLTDVPRSKVEEPDEPFNASRALLETFFEDDAAWRRRVRDGLAIARVLGRTLILPQPYCHCDRGWSPLKRCRMLEVPSMRLPFACPLDHVINVNLWERSGVSFRGPGFSRLADKKFTVTANMTDSLVAERLAPWANLDVIEVALDAPLCGLRHDFIVHGHPVVDVTKNFLGFTNYLLDQRITFCEAMPNTTNENACRAAEETSLKNPRRTDLGTVRPATPCGCESGFQLPTPLKIVQGDVQCT